MIFLVVSGDLVPVKLGKLLHVKFLINFRLGFYAIPGGSKPRPELLKHSTTSEKGAPEYLCAKRFRKMVSGEVFRSRSMRKPRTPCVSLFTIITKFKGKVRSWSASLQVPWFPVEAPRPFYRSGTR